MALNVQISRSEPPIRSIRNGFERKDFEVGTHLFEAFAMALNVQISRSDPGCGTLCNGFPLSKNAVGAPIRSIRNGLDVAEFDLCVADVDCLGGRRSDQSRRLSARHRGDGGLASAANGGRCGRSDQSRRYQGLAHASRIQHSHQPDARGPVPGTIPIVRGSRGSGASRRRSGQRALPNQEVSGLLDI